MSDDRSMQGQTQTARARRRQARAEGDAGVAGRETVRPNATRTAFAGPSPRLDPFAQLVGLALGAPEFQRR
jgi:hypothetical protein